MSNRNERGNDRGNGKNNKAGVAGFDGDDAGGGGGGNSRTDGGASGSSKKKSSQSLNGPNNQGNHGQNNQGQRNGANTFVPPPIDPRAPVNLPNHSGNNHSHHHHRHRPLPNAPTYPSSGIKYQGTSAPPQRTSGAPSAPPGPSSIPNQSNMLVCVRVRPLMSHDRTQKEVTRVLDARVVIILDPNKVHEKDDILRAKRSREKRYAFDRVFQPGDDNNTVYQNTTRYLLAGVLEGYNATVFAYGNTGAGKTHTMIGSVEEPGIMVLTLQDLFKLSEQHVHKHGTKFRVTVSFIEVYNENIRDLLSEVDEFLDLREDPIKGPVISGVTEVETNSSAEIMDLLHHGNRNRTQQATAANAVSSRSHAVLQVVVENRQKAEGTIAKIKIGKLSLVDLAGSERAAATKNKGIRLTEGANINRSLLALGNCINALGEKANRGQFVPYRDSKLTRLLKDSLGGNCRTVMIANISSAVSNFEETLNTLKYANRAKNIKTSVTRNELNVSHHISEYVNLITDLRSEINKLKLQLGGSDSASGGVMETVTKGLLRQNSGLRREDLPKEGGDGNLGEAVMEEARIKIVDNFKEKMQLRRSLIELEDQNVSNSIEVGKRQILIAEWNDARGETPKVTTRKKAGADGAGGDSDELASPRNEGEDDIMSGEFIEEYGTPEVKGAWHEVVQLRKAIDKNNNTKRTIAKRLRSNEKQAEKFRQELLTKVTGQDRKQLMELQYRIGKLELDNMELEQSRIVHDSMMKGKDLTIQKLQLQLAVRDKVITQQRAVLHAHNLEHLIGYTGLEIMQQAAITDNFDTLRMPLSGSGSRNRSRQKQPVPEMGQMGDFGAFGQIPQQAQQQHHHQQHHHHQQQQQQHHHNQQQQYHHPQHQNHYHQNNFQPPSSNNVQNSPYLHQQRLSFGRPINPAAGNYRSRRIKQRHHSQRDHNNQNSNSSNSSSNNNHASANLKDVYGGGFGKKSENVNPRFRSQSDQMLNIDGDAGPDKREREREKEKEKEREREREREKEDEAALQKARADRHRKRQQTKAAYSNAAAPPDRAQRQQQQQEKYEKRQEEKQQQHSNCSMQQQTTKSMLSHGIGPSGENQNPTYESPNAVSKDIKLQHQHHLLHQANRASPLSSGKKSNAVAPMPFGSTEDANININLEKDGNLRAAVPFVTSFPPKPMNT